MASLQIPMSALQPSQILHVTPLFSCHRFWDTRTARFTPCFVPFIETLPAILGALILIRYSLRILNQHQPGWTKPFLVESKEFSEAVEPETSNQPFTATFGLLAVASTGLASEITTVILPTRGEFAIYSTLTWAIVAAIVFVERPRTASLSLLSLFTALLCAHSGSCLCNIGHSPDPQHAFKRSITVQKRYQSGIWPPNGQPENTGGRFDSLAVHDCVMDGALDPEGRNTPNA